MTDSKPINPIPGQSHQGGEAGLGDLTVIGVSGLGEPEARWPVAGD